MNTIEKKNIFEYERGRAEALDEVLKIIEELKRKGGCIEDCICASSLFNFIEAEEFKQKLKEMRGKK